MPHARRQAALGLRHVHQPRLLVLALDVAHRVDAERLVLGRRKPQLRDTGFASPATSRIRPSSRPTPTPRPTTGPATSRCRSIASHLHAGGADAERRAGQVIVVRVEHDGEAVGFGVLIASGELPRDSRAAPDRSSARRHTTRPRRRRCAVRWLRSPVCLRPARAG